MKNVSQTIISQYANAASLVTLINAMNQWLDPQANLNAFFDAIWNVDTAVGVGLDIWGRIVGVGRVLKVTGGGKYLGFEEATSVSADPFNQSPFYTGQQTTQNFILSDDGFRTLIYAKALANICDGSIPGINQVLLYLFPKRGNCYVVDNGDMTLTYKFEFTLSPIEIAIVEQSGVLPRPTGVSASVVTA